MKALFTLTGIAAAIVAIVSCGGGSGTAAVDVTTLTATDLAAGVCGGSLSSASITSAYLDRVKAGADHNVFVTVDAAGAMQAAQAADARRQSGAPCLPLQGVPIIVKDNIQAAGLPSTAGTCEGGRAAGRPRWRSSRCRLTSSAP